eukprot:gene5635-9451_t
MSGICGKKETGGPIFGEALDVAADRSDPFKLVPYVLRASFGYLNKRGLEFEGIYRINGSKKTVQSYITRYDKGEKLNFLELSKKEAVSPCNIASLVLYYFKNLPESILTKDLEEEFFKVADMNDMTEKVKHVKKNVNRLPPCNKQTLKLFIEHLVYVAEKHKVNQMTVENLLLCITGASNQTPVFFVLILNYEEIFLGVTPSKEEKIQRLEKMNYVITTEGDIPRAKEGEFEENKENGKKEEEEKKNPIEMVEVHITNINEETGEVIKEEEEEKKDNVPLVEKEEATKQTNETIEVKQELEASNEVEVKHEEEQEQEEVQQKKENDQTNENDTENVEAPEKPVEEEVEPAKKENHKSEVKQIEEQIQKEIQDQKLKEEIRQMEEEFNES